MSENKVICVTSILKKYIFLGRFFYLYDYPQNKIIVFVNFFPDGLIVSGGHL